MKMQMMSVRMSKTETANILELPTVASSADFGLARRGTDTSCDAILALWDSSLKTVWRNTLQREREQKSLGASDQFFPTVTFRCLDALLTLLNDHPDWCSSKVRKAVMAEWLPGVLTREESNLQSTLNGALGDCDEVDPSAAEEKMSDGRPALNPFTLALYVRVFARITGMNLIPPMSKTSSERLAPAARDLVRHKVFARQGPDGAFLVHPFLLYHAGRALRVSIPHLQDSVLKRDAEERLVKIHASICRCVERMLAKKALGMLNPSESVAMAFCAAFLAQEPRSEDRQHILSALEVCFQAQDSSGCWPQGRVVREDKDISNDRLEISTYEIAAVLAECVVNLVRQLDEPFSTAIVREAVQRLNLAGQYTERSVVRISGGGVPSAGWCSDHAYGVEMIESWTSATVMESLLGLNNLLVEFNRQQILAKYTSVSSTDRDWPSWLRWEEFRTTSEVDFKYPVLTYLDNNLVRPVLNDPRNLPAINPRSVSVLLFGPPGTSKTTIAKAVADGLQWPVVLLSPGIFIEKGLEYIEAQAHLVFDDLMKLSRAVVVFDECDELFRTREPSKAPDQTRSITAFVTASMLPKLQDLHDRGRIIFFICTNNFESMDPAVKRGGRIDHILAVGPPDEVARKRIIAQLKAQLDHEKNETYPIFFDKCLNELELHGERFNRSEMDRAIRFLANSLHATDEQAARAQANNLIKRMNDSLTIGVEEYDIFTKQKEQFSHATTGGS